MRIEILETLFSEPACYRTFKKIVDERRIQHENLANILGIQDEDITKYVNQLRQVGLIEKSDAVLPKWSTYYVTATGLTAERNLRRFLES